MNKSFEKYFFLIFGKKLFLENKLILKRFKPTYPSHDSYSSF